MSKEIMLITYPDAITEAKKPPLQTLNKALKKYFLNFTAVHILPFFPATSDGGFAITEYKKVAFGSWNHINAIGKKYNLMIDFVLNHTSSKHSWFQKACLGNKKYIGYYTPYTTIPEHKQVFRPRSTPLFTKFGERYYVTTFSKDQVDLNYKNPIVVKNMIDIAAFYAQKNITYLRFDAAGYIWKDLDSASINTKDGDKIITKICNSIKPVIPVLELNFSNTIGNKGVHYNFALAPLVYYAFLTHDPKPLYDFLKEMKPGINVLSTHDGIPLLPGEKYLTKKQINKLVTDAKKKGFVSYKDATTPYELNVQLRTILGEQGVITGYALLLFLEGISGIYLNTLLGDQVPKKIKNNRDINRRKYTLQEIQKILPHKIYLEILSLIAFSKKIRGTSTIQLLKNNLLKISRGKHTLYVNFSKTNKKVNNKVILAKGYLLEEQ